MTKRTARLAPLTLEDLLLLLVRRLLIPVALAGLLFGGLAFLIAAPFMRRGGVDLLLFLAPGAIVAAGLILVGIPAGYALQGFGGASPPASVCLRPSDSSPSSCRCCSSLVPPAAFPASVPPSPPRSGPRSTRICSAGPTAMLDRFRIVSYTFPVRSKGGL